MARVDLFGVVHKGVRALLFELSTEAARVDLTSTAAVDALVARVERVLGFLDEHAMHEDLHVLSALGDIDPSLAAELRAEHRALDVVQVETERAAAALALAELSSRPDAGAHLLRVINHLVAVHLIHMNREETEVNASLWAGLTDEQLASVRNRLMASIPPVRFAEWTKVIAPALNPVERRLVVGDVVV